jgi:hypothetical protein
MNVLQKCFAAALAITLWLTLTMLASSAEIKGMIANVRAEKNEFVLADNFKNMTFRLAPDGMVLINGQRRTLRDLQAGDEASVLFERQDQQLIATVVHSTRRVPTTAHPTPPR